MGRMKCSYFDPPYNTGKDGFLYKDNYTHSTWITFIVLPQQAHHGQRNQQNNERLAAHQQSAKVHFFIPKRRVAKPFCAEKQQTQSGQRKVHANRNNQQHQGAGICQRLISQSVNQRPTSRHGSHRQQCLYAQRKLPWRGPGNQ